MRETRHHIGPMNRNELAEILREEANAYRLVELNGSKENRPRNEQLLELERLIEWGIREALLRVADRIDS